jgi:uncharacterized protein (DUF1015 family)
MDTKNKVTITICETEVGGQRVFLVQSMVNSIEFSIGASLYPCDVEQLLRSRKNQYTVKIVGLKR